jgi:outer membrane receptor protein involved in Fe transport
MIFRMALGGMTLAAAAFSLTTANAQQVTQPTDSDTPLQEVVVTANKREERLSTVGLTVSVLGASELTNNQITSLADIAKTIPGLSYANSANGTPVYTLRGVGFYETSIGSYPTVSIYQDQVPLSFPVLTRHSAFDLDRIEVLKGPQGTLFGQNSTGGAINYIAAKPTRDLEGSASVSYGRFNDVLGEAYLSGPINDQLRARLAVQSERADGWQYSSSRPDDHNGRIDYDTTRFQLDFTPGDRVHFLVAINAWWDRSDTQAPQFFGFNLQQPVIGPDLKSSQISSAAVRRADWTPGDTGGDNSMSQFSLRGDFGLTDSISLTSISAYTHYRQSQADEGDGLPISDDDLTTDRGTINNISQELRISNAGGQRDRWVVGATYDHSGVLQDVHVDYVDSSVNTTFGQPNFFYPGSPPYPIRAADYYTRQNFQDVAAFGNIDFDVIPTVTLKAGVRYTDSKDRAKSCSANNTDLVGGTGQFFYDLIAGGAFGPYVAGDCFPINSTSTTINGVAPGAPGLFGGDLDQRNVSWRGGVDWRPMDGLLLYANAAKGFKAGSFPTLSGSAFVQYFPVREESILSYETGAKVALFDRRVELDGSAFYYDYKDKQLRSKILAEPFGILDTLQNIPKSTVKGAELAVNSRPFKGLTLNVAATYLQATIDRFTGINAGGLAANFDDTPIPFTPKWQIGSNADYTFGISSSWNAFVGASVNFRSDTIAIVGGNLNFPVSPYNAPNGLPASPANPYRIDQYTLVDVRAGVQSRDEKWRFSVWGKNVTDRYYLTNVVAAFDCIVRYTGMPATYGVSASYQF